MSSDIQRLPRLEVVALIESRAREARARQGLGTLALFRCFAPSPEIGFAAIHRRRDRECAEHC